MVGDWGGCGGVALGGRWEGVGRALGGCWEGVGRAFAGGEGCVWESDLNVKGKSNRYIVVGIF